MVINHQSAFINHQSSVINHQSSITPVAIQTFGLAEAKPLRNGGSGGAKPPGIKRAWGSKAPLGTVSSVRLVPLVPAPVSVAHPGADKQKLDTS